MSQEKGEFDTLLEKWSHWITLRICAWIARFVFNTQVPSEERKKNPLTTEELDVQRPSSGNVEHSVKESGESSMKKTSFNLNSSLIKMGC